MGCHEMAGAFWAMKLDEAETCTVDAESAGGTTDSYPAASTIAYRFPARGEMGPVTVHWYDGGRRPPRPKEFPAAREFVGSSGTIFVGEKGRLTFGAITAGTHPGQAGPRFIPESLADGFRKPQQTLPRIKGKETNRHQQEWIAACKGKKPACSRFEIAGPLTEIVLLGNVAIQTGKPIEWSRKEMKIVNEPDANRLLRRAYRKGWSL
jgi:hypothetical protein